VNSDEIRQHLLALPAVGTRVVVPGGGRDRTCCKAIEPPPVSWGTFTVAAGPVCRLVHIEGAVNLRLCRPHAQLNRQRALRQAQPSPANTHANCRAHIPAPLTPTPPPPPPLYLVAQLHYFYTSLASIQKQMLRRTQNTNLKSKYRGWFLVTNARRLKLINFLRL
jgi:hypothetical protein